MQKSLKTAQVASSSWVYLPIFSSFHAVPKEKSRSSHQYHPIAPRTALQCAHPSVPLLNGSRLCNQVDWAAQRACQLLSLPISLHQSCPVVSSSAARSPAAMRTSWIRHVSAEATAHFPSRLQPTPTPFISTALQTPACPWRTARPTFQLLRNLSQSAVQMRVQERTQAEKRRGGSRCSSHSSPRITWRTTGQLR